MDDGVRIFDWLRNWKRTENGAVPIAAPSPLVEQAKAYVLSDLSIWRTLQGHDPSTARPYATHPWVFRAVRVKEQSAAGLPIRLYTNPDKPKEIVEHPVLAMLKNPNEQLSGRDLIQGIVNHLDLCGNALLVVVRSGSSGALVPLDPRRVRVLREGNHALGYQIFGVGGAQTFPAHQVLHIKYPSDDDPLWGVSPMEAARKSYLDDVGIRSHNASILNNSGVPRGVLSSDQAMTESQVKENQARWESTHTGAENAGKTALLTGGLAFQPIGVTQQEFDFIETRKLSRDEIFSIFGVPVSKANGGISDEGNHRSLERGFWNDTMIPLVEGTIADSINSQMWKLEGRREFAVEPLFVRFDLSQVPELIRQKQEMQAIDLQKLTAGAMTQNEFRAKWQEGDPVKWGNVWWKPFGLEPIRDETVPTPEPVQIDDEDDDGKRAAVVPFIRSPKAPDTTQSDASSATAAYQTRASDAMQWMGFLAKLSGKETQLAELIRDVMSEWERETIANLRKANKGFYEYGQKDEQVREDDVLRMLFDKLKASVALVSISKRPLREAQEIGGKRGLKLAGRPASFLFRTADPNAVRMLRAQLQRFALPVAETTWERLKDTLLRGLQSRETEAQLTERVRDVMANRRFEAQRIAATETAAAVNGGVSLGFMQSKVVTTKRWITAGDEHVRETHQAANGQEVSVKQAFSVGGASLMFPGDPGGPASEVINCRCTLVPGEIIEGEDTGNVTEVGA